MSCSVLQLFVYDEVALFRDIQYNNIVAVYFNRINVSARECD